MSHFKKALYPLASIAVGIGIYVGACGEPEGPNQNSDPGPSPTEVTSALAAKPFEWQVVVNTNDQMPNSELTFNSFNPPAVNQNGRVVFRARSKGSEAGRARGIYAMNSAGSAAGRAGIEVVVDATTNVPQPNNLGKSFTEFPSVPRIDSSSDLTSTRGQHSPVWKYVLGDGSETRVGTTGIYTNTMGQRRTRALDTAGSIVGAAPGYERFAVPGMDPPLKFDVFPGSPSPTTSGGKEIVTFKGNYTLPSGSQTGVFFRTLGGDDGVELVANTSTPLPNQPAAEPDATFGSTATPSADAGNMVFTGYIEEWVPSRGGGIYLAPIEPNPPLTTLVGIGDPVPGVEGATFGAFGEALSYNGRSVAFWGAWGAQARELFLACPTKGNKDRRDYCNANLPQKDPACTENCVHGATVSVPVNQGIFVHNTTTGNTELVVTTGDQFTDFVYWNYSGHVPGAGGGHGGHGGEGGESGESGEGEEGGGADAEEPRWRSSAFFAHSALAGNVAFKARAAAYDAGDKGYTGINDGLYIRQNGQTGEPQVMFDMSSPASLLDPEAPEGAMVTEFGIERDGFRGRWLSITATMEVPGGEEESGIAGIYRTNVTVPPVARGKMK